MVHLAKDSRTWRVFPLPIERANEIKTILNDDGFQLYKNGRTDNNTRDKGIVSAGPYTPVFCLQVACWLNEASWQAYYSPPGMQTERHVAGMNLESLGLRLEGAVLDEETDTQVYVATNATPQVDGDEDSVIVVAFRGTDSASNIQTDFRSRQVSDFSGSLYLLLA